MAGNLPHDSNELLMDPRPRWYWVARAAMLILGLVLTLSGGIKALDLNLFMRQIQGYALITHPLLTALAAWIVTTVECFLGAALLINYRPRQVLNLTLLLLAAFTLLTLYAAIRGNVEDCGCFGALVKRTPKQAAAEDAVLIFLAVIARRGVLIGTGRPVLYRTMVVLAVTLAGAIAPLFTGVPSALLGSPPEGAQEIWSDLAVEGIEGVALDSDAHLVVIMAADCQHCQEVVPELAMLMEELESLQLPMIGLGQDSVEALQDFISEWMPPYPIGRIEADAFWTLLGDAELPRIILVKDGRTIHAWDGALPAFDEIAALLTQ